ncbi:FMN-binding negative transcriptional regulator [Limnovirga soli]|uniref:FMN-binding negative transcriptional regulator n=1 Tax=Limnovirga soli TaxID=2656915 RepID=A0A8J8JUV8_9BACT|nr:FMN-binding negative transcriptional regulator [Limnovirga soli]NNV57438.1 FMN-binding negative transcriptional regulator [Limnovirga soli]
MYHTPYFKAADNEDVLAFMQAHPFILLCGTDTLGKPVATHVPVLIEERDGVLYLQAHIMRKQQHTRAFENNPNVLAVFQGAHTYVSASWYQHPQTASTWNYQAVHASGQLRFLNEEGLLTLLAKLTRHFENEANSPALVEKMEDTYLQQMMKAIVGFEIEITALEHVFKLSQNRDEKTYDNIINQLETQGTDAKEIAANMQQQKHQIFPK